MMDPEKRLTVQQMVVLRLMFLSDVSYYDGFVLRTLVHAVAEHPAVAEPMARGDYDAAEFAVHRIIENRILLQERA